MENRFTGAENRQNERSSGRLSSPVDRYNSEFIPNLSYFSDDHGACQHTTQAPKRPADPQAHSDEQPYSSKSYHQAPKSSSPTSRVDHSTSSHTQSPWLEFQREQQRSWQLLQQQQNHIQTRQSQQSQNLHSHQNQGHNAQHVQSKKIQHLQGQNIQQHSHGKTGHEHPHGSQSRQHQQHRQQSEGHFNSHDLFHNIWSVSSPEGNLGPDVLKPGAWLQGSETTSYRNPYQEHQAQTGTYRSHPSNFDNQSPISDGPQMLSTPQYKWSTSDGVTDSSVPDLSNFNWDQAMYSSAQYPNTPTCDNLYRHGSLQVHSPASIPTSLGTLHPTLGGQDQIQMFSENRELNEWELESEQLRQRRLTAANRAKQGRKHHQNPRIASLDDDRDSQVVASFLEKYRGDEMPSLSSESSMESSDGLQSSHVANFDPPQKDLNEEISEAAQLAELSSDGPIVTKDNLVSQNGDSMLTHQALDNENTYNIEPHNIYPVVTKDDSAIKSDSSEARRTLQSHVDQVGRRESRSHSDPVTFQETFDVKSTKMPLSKKVSNNGKIRPGKRKPKIQKEKRRSASGTSGKSDAASQSELKLNTFDSAISDQVSVNCVDLHKSFSKSEISEKNGKHLEKPKDNIPDHNRTNNAINTPSVSATKVEDIGSFEAQKNVTACCMCDSGSCQSSCCNSNNLWIPVKETVLKTTKSSGHSDDGSSVDNGDSSQTLRQCIEQCLRADTLKEKPLPAKTVHGQEEKFVEPKISRTSKIGKGKSADSGRKSREDTHQGLKPSNHDDVIQQKSNKGNSAKKTKEEKFIKKNHEKRGTSSNQNNSKVQPKLSSKPLMTNEREGERKALSSASSLSSERETVKKVNQTSEIKDKTLPVSKSSPEKNKSMEKGVFFDPKRIFGGKQSAKTLTESAKREPVLPENTKSKGNPFLKINAEQTKPSEVKKEKHKQNVTEVLGDLRKDKHPHESHASLSKEKPALYMNGSIPNLKSTKLHQDDHVPLWCKDAFVKGDSEKSPKKDSASKPSFVMGGENTSKKDIHSEPLSDDIFVFGKDEPLSSPTRRTPQAYCFKRDEKTGKLMSCAPESTGVSSTDLDEGPTSSRTKANQKKDAGECLSNSIKDIFGTQSRGSKSDFTSNKDPLQTDTCSSEKDFTKRKDLHGDEAKDDVIKGERRCSGDSHMDGFHHPFGCSADCYKRTLASSTCPNNGSHSSPRDISSPRNGTYIAPSSASWVPSASSSSSAAATASPEASSTASRDLPKSARSASNSSFTNTSTKNEDFTSSTKFVQTEKLKFDFSNLPEEKLKHRSEENQNPKAEEKQKQNVSSHQHHEKQTRKPQSSTASHPRRPTRATYSQSKDTNTTKDGHRHGQSKERAQARESHASKTFSTHADPEFDSGQSCHTGSSSVSPERRQRERSGDRQRTEKDASDRSDTEDDLAVDTEWWVKLGKNFLKGAYWMLLFAVLLCLVLLSFILALLKDALKFLYKKGSELWAYYQQSQSNREDYFSYRGDDPDPGRQWWSSGGGIPRSEPNRPRRGQQRQRVKKMQSVDLPTTEEAAIFRILACDPDDLYEVLGVAEDAKDDEIKRYYRKQCMLVHPDKTRQPRANEAFQILQKAYATLSDEIKRREYDMELNYKGEMEEKVEEFFSKMEEMANSMSCGVCNGMHRRYDTVRPLHAARYCARHNARHSVRDGALWKETANLGFKIFVYHCDGMRVYDVTEWAACQELDWMEPDTCQLQCRVKRGPKQQTQRQQTNQGYQDVFDNIFGSGAYRQFHAAASHQGYHGNSNSGPGGGGGGQSNSKSGGASKNNQQNRKKNRKKKK